MHGLMRAAGWAIYDFRCSVSMWFLRRALRLMPEHWSIRDGIERGIREQLEYDHYCGYTKLLGADPWPFSRWHEVSRTLKAHSRPRPFGVQDTSHLHVVRETRA